MEATVASLEENKIKVSVTVDASAVDEKIDKIYKDYARKYNFPGFRKGKAPRPVIDNALGRETLLAAATEDVINDAYPEVIEEKRIYPVGSADFGEPGMVEPKKPFSFEFTIAVKPEIELSSYDPVKVELPLSGATEAEIDEQVETLRQHYEEYDNAPASTKLSADSFADIALSAQKEDGEEIEALKTDSRFFAPGSGFYSEAFEEQLFGLKKGETKEFTLDIPADESALLLSDLAGQKITFTVTCNVVKTMSLPELTDEWVKEKLAFDSVDEMRKEIETSIADQKESVIPRIKENACAMELIERVQDEIPESMAEEAEAELLQDFFSQLQKQGVSFDQYLMQRGIDSTQFKEDVKKQALDEAKQQLALDAWARKMGIEATDEDVTLEFERAGVENPKATEKQWRKSGRLYLIREGIVRQKAMENVMETAQVEEVDFLAKEKEAGKKDAKKTSKKDAKKS